MDRARIGRCRALAREHALAFAMVTHPRLGRAQGLADHLVEMVVEACRKWPEGAAGKEEGVVRVLGGGLIWRGKA